MAKKDIFSYLKRVKEEWFEGRSRIVLWDEGGGGGGRERGGGGGGRVGGFGGGSVG